MALPQVTSEVIEALEGNGEAGRSLRIRRCSGGEEGVPCVADACANLVRLSSPQRRRRRNGRGPEPPTTAASSCLHCCRLTTHSR